MQKIRRYLLPDVSYYRYVVTTLSSDRWSAKTNIKLRALNR